MEVELMELYVKEVEKHVKIGINMCTLMPCIQLRLAFKTPLGGHHSSPPSQASPDTKEEIDRSPISRAPLQNPTPHEPRVQSGCGVLFGSEKEVSVMVLVCRCGFGGVGSSVVVGSGGLGGGRVVWAE
ncbi:hypothetical protein G4B88_009191 [Cannabis sativa]|uniref:Uncharacterized protein n=1 Tax=Cannabis sativa TaxID=3483 RepID=A0A7J6G542_CANSA|nr:hypothetical protein G4B88_009191 [Cannabis sativa]